MMEERRLLKVISPSACLPGCETPILGHHHPGRQANVTDRVFTGDHHVRSHAFYQIRPAVAARLMALLTFAVLTAGCSQGEQFQRAPVDGYVSIDGAPLKAGSIRFIPAGDAQGPAAVATIDEGIYELPAESGPVVGPLRIEIEAINHFGFEVDDEAAYAKQVAGGQKPPQNPVPESFNRHSKIVIEFPAEGQSNLDFRLTSAGVLADSR